MSRLSLSDNGAWLTQGADDELCLGRGKAAQARREKFNGGYAWLTFAIPKTAKGKQLTVKATITASGQTASRVATYIVS
jgi:hypothetical protein